MFLFTDGASRGNPGESGIGFALFENNKLLLSGAYFIGIGTNNLAEIIAILIALKSIEISHLFYLKNKIIIKSDSLLLVNQFNKKFAIKNEKLKLAHNLFSTNFGMYCFEFIHIPREDNTFADNLANKGINEKIILPENLYSSIFSLLH